VSFQPFQTPREALDRIFALKSAQRLAEALAVAEDAWRDFPNHATVAGQTAHLRHLCGRTEAGLEVLADAAYRFELPDFVLSIEADLLAAAGRPDDARANIDRILAAADPTEPALRRCAEVLHRLGDQPRVEVLLDRIVAQARDRRAALLLALRLGGDKTARLRPLQDEFPDDPAVIEHVARQRLDGLDPEEKAEELGLLLDTSRGRDLDRVRVARALALRKAGHSQEAMDELEQVLQKNPRNAFALTHLGLCCRDLGRTSEAIDHFEEALRTRADDAITRKLLFSLYKSADARERAEAFVAEMAASHPAHRGGWWGALKRAFK
jgi:tetratricopeptide (TPR) repeat protein